MANDTKCPARNTKVTNCGLIGHFTKACRRKNPRTVKVVEEFETESQDASDEDDTNMFILNIEEEQIDNVNENSTTKTRKPICSMTIGGVAISIVADSGSPYTIVNKKTWDEKFKPIIGGKLREPDITIKSFTGDPIEVCGFRELDFVFKGHETEGKLYVSRVGPSVLGWMDQGKLGIILDPSKEDPVLCIANDVDYAKSLLVKFPKVFFGEVGALKGYLHKIKVKPNSIPVVHKARNLPFTIRDEVKVQLEKLLASGIIERMDASEWVAPLVVAK